MTFQTQYLVHFPTAASATVLAPLGEASRARLLGDCLATRASRMRAYAADSQWQRAGMRQGGRRARNNIACQNLVAMGNARIIGDPRNSCWRVGSELRRQLALASVQMLPSLT